MADTIKTHKLVDTTDRGLVKLILISDGTDRANTLLLDASTLKYALNANGYILGAGTDKKTTYRTSIKRIYGSGHLKNNGYVKIQWQGATNSEIILIHDGPFNYDFESMGDGALIPNPEASSNGNILYTTISASAGDNFVLFVDLEKDNQDYDAGQSADPYAFNRTP